MIAILLILSDRTCFVVLHLLLENEVQLVMDKYVPLKVLIEFHHRKNNNNSRMLCYLHGGIK